MFHGADLCGARDDGGFGRSFVVKSSPWPPIRFAAANPVSGEKVSRDKFVQLVQGPQSRSADIGLHEAGNVLKPIPAADVAATQAENLARHLCGSFRAQPGDHRPRAWRDSPDAALRRVAGARVEQPGYRPAGLCLRRRRELLDRRQSATQSQQPVRGGRQCRADLLFVR